MRRSAATPAPMCRRSRSMRNSRRWSCPTRPASSNTPWSCPSTDLIDPQCPGDRQRVRFCPMSLLARLSETVGDAFEAAGVDRSYGTVVVSKRPDLGQFQCTGALAAARSVGRNPREIAQTVINALTATEMFAAVSIAGPGFINLTLTDAAITAVTQAAVDDERCGCTLVERPVRYIVDFGGPTVAKAMHVGHLRSTIIGDSLQRLLRFLGH
ncbi:MAG TPA: arginine--tRNA ligase, partial [Actinobacteria bacterium]|nr:arginine--tRNA ligase [Actinomycetota bacterium]